MRAPMIEETQWLTLGEASRLLGMHPATIRQWSDEGKLAVFRTPGGHRRFSRDDVERLLHVMPVRGVGLQSYLVSEAVERTRRTLPAAFGDADWVARLPEEERAYWRDAGRQLVGMVAQLVSREDISQEQRAAAMRFGEQYGRMMARAAHTLPDAVIAFLFFRDALLETVIELPETTGLERSSVLMIVDRANALLNSVLRRMIVSFQNVASDEDDPHSAEPAN